MRPRSLLALTSAALATATTIILSPTAHAAEPLGVDVYNCESQSSSWYCTSSISGGTGSFRGVWHPTGRVVTGPRDGAAYFWGSGCRTTPVVRVTLTVTDSAGNTATDTEYVVCDSGGGDGDD